MEEALLLPAGAVVRDDSQTIWVKRGLLAFQRPGSIQDYDWHALVFPLLLLWPVSRERTG